jgi:fumarate reductase flavoprotein subunit
VAYAYLKDYKHTRPDLYHEASTLAELARQMGMPADQLNTSVQAYNQAIQADSTRTRQPISQGPFYALGPVMSWIVFTEGGLAVTARHEVTRPDGQRILGLWAAGSAGQGGTILAGHGHHIGWAMTSGRRAGRFAAERAIQR